MAGSASYLGASPALSSALRIVAPACPMPRELVLSLLLRGSGVELLLLCTARL